MRLKLKLLACAVAMAAVMAMVLGTTAVLAQEEPPAPYAGMKNPFPWDDGQATTAGQTVYKTSCLGCHGTKGDSQTAFDFSKPAYSENLRARPDFYMWVVSEGRLSQGMPGFKSLSEQQRWQVLTYINSLSAGGAAGGGEIPAAEPTGLLRLSAPAHAASGTPFALTASLEDKQGKPVAGAEVKFFIEAQLFTSGLMEIGSATSNEQGVAVLSYTPRHEGVVAAVVRSGSNEGRANVDIGAGSEIGYEAEAGINFPELGASGIIYPRSVLDLRAGDQAPLPAFHLPGGVASWMFLLVGTVFMIWFTYFRVWYQVFRIPAAGDRSEVNVRLLPMLGMAFVTSVGLMLILKLLISPYTHLHIPLS